MPEMVLRTALYLRNASFHLATLESGFVLQQNGLLLQHTTV